MKRIIHSQAYALCLLSAAAALTLPAQTLTTFLVFDGPDGGPNYAPLVQGTDGNLYGTTQEGGAYHNGTIFKITPNGVYTRLYSFCLQGGPYCADGSGPNAPLIQAPDGDFYGTTENGGADCGSEGTFDSGGTVFKVSPSGTLTTLYTFTSHDFGCNPAAGLVQAPNGDLYGTTAGGPYGHSGGGTIFKISPSGALTTLYRFCTQGDCTDGQDPSGLVLASDGNFYGTTQFGGTGVLGIGGPGTVFKITPAGTFTTLYSFCPLLPCTDGAEPYASEGLIQTADGNFYGTTILGGAYNSGTVFKITPSGVLSTLYSFCSKMATNGACTDGSDPAAGLIQAPGGDFYGTTGTGGPSNLGTIFTMTPNGALTTLHSFCEVNYDGCAAYPGPLAQATNGNVYGTTSYGGVPGGSGTIFRLSMGLGPFVEPQTTFGQVGSAVNILGTDLTGATSVSFNGASAVFTVVSATEITAIVPAGATTGTVQVLTPRGTLSSNVPFRVLP